MPKALTIECLLSNKKPESRLTPLSFVNDYFEYPNGRKERGLKCLCVCGTMVIVRVGHFLRGSLLSCGCKKRENVIKRNSSNKGTADLVGRKIYQCYKGMMSRCYNKKNKQYPNYGGRGVRVCDEWVNDYMAFRNWAIERWKQGLDLDKDTLGDGLLYSPETCCFITQKVNRGFTRKTKRILYKEKIMSHYDICRLNNIDPTTVNSRIERGWSFEDAVEKPLRKNQYA